MNADHDDNDDKTMYTVYTYIDTANVGWN